MIARKIKREQTKNKKEEVMLPFFYSIFNKYSLFIKCNIEFLIRNREVA